MERIRFYVEGVQIEPEEDNIEYAKRLDAATRLLDTEGRFSEVYRNGQKVLAISIKHDSLAGIQIGLSHLSSVIGRGGNFDEALYLRLLVFKVTEAMNNLEEIGLAELALSHRLFSRDRTQARMWLLRAKEHLENTRYQEDYVSVLVQLARDLRSMGEVEQASAMYDEAWELAQPLDNRENPAHRELHLNLGRLYSWHLAQSGNYEKAMEVLANAETYFNPSQKETTEYIDFLLSHARIHSDQGHREQAQSYYLAAYTSYQLARARAPGEEGRAQLDDNYKSLVDEFVDYHLDSGDDAQALALLESNKARTLNDILEDPSYKETAAQWKEVLERHASQRLSLLEGTERISFRETSESVSELLKRQRDELRTMKAELQLKDITVTESLSEEQVNAIRDQLTPDIAVLSFYIRSGRVSVLLIMPEGTAQVPLLMSPGELRRTAQQLRLALTNPYNDFYREPAQLLFKEALAPALSKLPETTRIILYSADGILSRVPLSVLMDGEKFLGESYSFFNVPSLRYVSSVQALKKRPARSGVSCVDPDVQDGRLPFQRATAETLQELYGDGVTGLAGERCSEKHLVAAIDQTGEGGFLHIGAHGNFYPENPMESAIWLSSTEEGGQPYAWNARAMSTVNMEGLDLITLSGCETGLTDPTLERDVFGIARALFFAGAKSFVAPLWAVHDRSTAQLMQAFYTSYAAGTPAVLALQEAQLELLASGEFSHPNFWSAFILMGSAR